MPQVRLRLSHAGTAAQQTLTNDEFVDGELERLVSVQDRLQTVSELSVTVEVATVLGVAQKRLPPGRHRAVVEVDRDGVWEVLADGTLTNERASHGRAYGGLRRWALTVVDDAVEVAWGRLEGVQIRAAAASGQTSIGRYDTEWRRATGGGLEPVVHACWAIRDLTDIAVWAAGLPAAPSPPPYAGGVGGAAPLAVLCAPRPEPGSPAIYGTVPNWTGGQLVEYRCESEQLVMEASYAAWPDAAIGGLSLRSVSARVPQPGTAAFGALVSVDDDGTGEPWHDAYDWSTEPGDEDGRSLDDFALVYRGGPDGSYIGDSGGILELPLQATYAARTVALTGLRAPGRDGGRVAENGQVLELPVLLAASEAATAAGTGYRTLQLGGYAVDVSRPVYDAADGSPDEDAVYLLSLILLADDGDRARAVVERRGADGRPAHELWARELYGSLAYAVGDADVMDLTVPAEAVPPGSVVIGDASRGVVCEGLAWIVRSVARLVDAQDVTLSLARPAGADSQAEEPRPGTGGREEPAPILTARVSQTTDTDDQGQTTYYVDELVVEVTLALDAETPGAAGFELQTVGTEVQVTPTSSTARSVTYQQSSAQGQGEASPQPQPNVFAGTQWRARVRYPSGTLTVWVTTTAS